MKAGTATDPKEKDSPAQVSMEQPPVKVVYKSKAPWALALLALLSIAVVTAGFLGAFYMMKEASTDHADQIQQFLMASREQQEKIISYSIQMQQAAMEQPQQPMEQPEEPPPAEPEAPRPVMYHDNSKGLTVLVDEAQNACFLHAPDRDDLDEDLRTQYLSQHPDPDGPKDTNSTLKPHDEEMEDTSLLGPNIEVLCENKEVFWLFPGQEGETEPEEEGTESEEGETEPEEQDEDKGSGEEQEEPETEDSGGEKELIRKKRSGYYGRKGYGYRGYGRKHYGYRSYGYKHRGYGYGHYKYRSYYRPKYYHRKYYYKPKYYHRKYYYRPKHYYRPKYYRPYKYKYHGGGHYYKGGHYGYRGYKGYRGHRGHGGYRKKYY